MPTQENEQGVTEQLVKGCGQACDQLGKVAEVLRPGTGAKVDENVKPRRGVPVSARTEFLWRKIVIKGRENIFRWRKLRTQAEDVAKMGAGSPVSDPGRSRPDGRAKTY